MIRVVTRNISTSDKGIVLHRHNERGHKRRQAPPSEARAGTHIA